MNTSTAHVSCRHKDCFPMTTFKFKRLEAKGLYSNKNHGICTFLYPQGTDNAKREYTSCCKLLASAMFCMH